MASVAPRLRQLLVALLAAPACEAAVDASSLTGKVLWGYQGWFGPSPHTAPGYGNAHWSSDGQPVRADSAVFDAFPDFSEYPASALQPADSSLTYSDGRPVQVYSATSGSGAAVNLHFQWMEKYGIDGVFLQRFATEIQTFSGPQYEFRNAVLAEVSKAAASTGRVWAIEWDITGTGSDTARVENTLSDDFANNIRPYTSLPNYLHHNGKPVVAIFGFGFAGDAYPNDPVASINAIRNLQIAYNVYVVGAVPFYWRTGTADSRPGFLDVYRTFDALSPWSVGRYNSEDTFNHNFQEVLRDREWTAQHEKDYAPVIWPGFSWANLQKSSKSFNQIPRLGGAFFQAQADALVQRLAPSATFLFGAMFDEWNEGTAIAKIAANKEDVPAQGCCWLYANADPGVSITSDHYLQLAGQLQQAFTAKLAEDVLVA